MEICNLLIMCTKDSISSDSFVRIIGQVSFYCRTRLLTPQDRIVTIVGQNSYNTVDHRSSQLSLSDELVNNQPHRTDLLLKLMKPELFIGRISCNERGVKQFLRTNQLLFVIRTCLGQICQFVFAINTLVGQICYSCLSDNFVSLWFLSDKIVSQLIQWAIGQISYYKIEK